MAEAILINRDDLVKFTSLNGITDTDKFIQYVKIAQDIHLQNILGTKLLRAIQDKITNSTLTGDYLALVKDYIKPILIHYSMVEYLPFAPYTISNKGVYKHSSETSETVSKDEVDKMVWKERQTAQNYTERFLDYICNNTSKFPEYNENTNSDVYPSGKNYFGGWHL
jgi:hypothetical protein